MGEMRVVEVGEMVGNEKGEVGKVKKNCGGNVEKVSVDERREYRGSERN